MAGRRLGVALLAAGVACTGAWLAQALPVGVLAAMGAGLLAPVCVLAGRQAAQHSRLARQVRAVTQPGWVAGLPARVGDLDGQVFVAGLLGPQVFVDRALLDRLTEPEARAVALHEEAHRRGRDPLRLVLLARAAAAREVAADRHALASGASRQALLAALFKTAPARAAHAPGFTPAVDLRLKALLDGQQPSTVGWRSAGLGVAVGLAACLVLAQPLQLLAMTVACCS